MMEVTVLGSGSAGNSLMVRGEHGILLVDAGLSCKQLELRLEALGVRAAEVAAVLMTHEHSDHAAGLRVFLKRWKTPCYCNVGTARALADAIDGAPTLLFENMCPFEVAGFRVRAFPVPHDAADPVGFRIEAPSAAFAVLTDLGCATKLVREAVRGVHALVLETNYDEALLQSDTKRPWSVKQRISSRHGHLSNAAAAEFVAALEAPELQWIGLAHLSQDCNSPELATAAIAAPLATRPRPPELFCAAAAEPSAGRRLAPA